MHTDIWQYAEIAVGNIIIKISKTLEQVKAALKNGIDNTKSFSKSKVLVETTPNTSGRKASFRSLLFSMLELCFFFYS